MNFLLSVSPNKVTGDRTKRMGARDYGGNCGNLNIEGTNEYCAASHKDTLNDE